MPFLRASCALLLPLFFAACAASLEDPARFEGGGGGGGDAGGSACSSATVESELLPTSCGSSICHAAGENAAAGLDLVTAGMQERLGAATSSETCGSVPILVPGDADGSLLFQKVGAAPPCGSPMPLGQPALSEEQLGCISDWIGGMQ